MTIQFSRTSRVHYYKSRQKPYEHGPVPVTCYSRDGPKNPPVCHVKKRIGTWNSRIFFAFGRHDNVIEEIKLLKLDILGIRVGQGGPATAHAPKEDLHSTTLVIMTKIIALGWVLPSGEQFNFYHRLIRGAD